MELILLADDTNIFVSNKCLDSLINRVNIEIILISTWFKINKLSLSIKKNMLFCNKRIRKVKPSVKIYIDNILIEQVAETKFLGVIINKVSKGIELICKIRH